MKNILEKISKTSFNYKEDFIKLSLCGGITVFKKGYDADSFFKKRMKL